MIVAPGRLMQQCLRHGQVGGLGASLEPGAAQDPAVNG
jgi:hypothetical protein